MLTKMQTDKKNPLSHEKFRIDKIQNIKMEQSKQYTTVIHSNIY